MTDIRCALGRADSEENGRPRTEREGASFEIWYGKGAGWWRWL